MRNSGLGPDPVQSVKMIRKKSRFWSPGLGKGKLDRIQTNFQFFLRAKDVWADDSISIFVFIDMKHILDFCGFDLPKLFQ